jgi:hypothetical protein
VAVSVHVSAGFDSVVLLDEGVPRAERMHDRSGLIIGGPPGYILGYDNKTTGFGFSSIRISERGLTPTYNRRLFVGFETDMVYYDRWVFASSGDVIDVSDPEQPRHVGKSFHGRVIPQQECKVVILSPEPNYEAVLFLFDAATLKFVKNANVHFKEFYEVLSFVQFKLGCYAVLSGSQKPATVHVISAFAIGGGRVYGQPLESTECVFDTQCVSDWICHESHCVAPGDRSDGSSRCAVPGRRSDSSDDPRLGDPPTTAVTESSTELVATSLLADPSRHLAYATIPGNAEKYPNSLIALNAGGEIVSSVEIGAEPESMAISDDHTTLWVGLRGSRSIRRVDLNGSEPTPGVEHQLPPDRGGDVEYAGSIVVLPGKPNSVAVCLYQWMRLPRYNGLVLLDNGIPRFEPDRSYDGGRRLTGGPPGYLYGFDDESTGFGFYSYRISEHGLLRTEYRNLVGGFGMDIVYYDRRVFGGGGEVIDVSHPELPRLLGKFAFYGSVIPQQDGTVVMLSKPPEWAFIEAGREATLRLLDIATLTQLKSAPAGLKEPKEVMGFVQIEPGTYAVLAGEDYKQATIYLMSAPSFKR